jgi:hypothetical protein
MTVGAAVFLVALAAMFVLDRVPFDAYLHTDARDRERERLRGVLVRPGRDLERRWDR